MADTLTRKQRSYCMSRIRSRWTSQEKKIHNYLKGRKIRHKMHPRIYGSPDLILKGRKTAIFLHGCFWHKCPKCYREPKSNRSYWIPKIDANVARDQRAKRMLRRNGWKVVKFWDHEIKSSFEKCMEKIEGMV